MAYSSPASKTDADGARPPSSKLERNARIVLVTSLIGWSLANMDQSFFTWAYPRIQSDLHISLTQVSYLYDGIFIAGWLATFAVGPLMERFGRKPMFQATLITTGIGSVISGVSSLFSVLFAGRIVASAGASAENFTSQVMNIESIPGRRKGMLVAIAQTGYPLGYFLSAGLSLLLLDRIGWHGIFLLGVLPVLFVIALRVLAREPERSRDILRLRKAARASKRSAEAVNLDQIETHYRTKKDEAVESPLRQLFLPDMRRTTILLALWFFLVNIANAEGSIYLPTIAAMRHISQHGIQLIAVITTALAVVGYLTNAYLGTRIGRRNAIAVYYIVGMVIGLLIAFLGNTPKTFGVLWVLWYFFSYGIYGSAITYIMESFPTRIRGMGSNFVGQFVWLGVLVWSIAGAHVLTSMGATASMLITMIGVALVSLAVLMVNRNIPPALELEDIAI